MDIDDSDLLDNARQEQELRAETAQEGALNETYRKAAERLGMLLERSGGEEVILRGVRVIGARDTRQSFLDQIITPSLSTHGSLKSCLDGLSEAANKLAKFDIYETVSLDIDALPTESKNDIAATIRLKERSRLWSRAGTDVGNQEGSAYTTVHLRNVFGGAESLEASFTKGTRTKTSYEVKFATPVRANPDSIFEVAGYGATKVNTYASHDEHIEGISAKFKHVGRWAYHEIGVVGADRQIANIREGASFSLRQAAGLSRKVSLLNVISRDRRDNLILPTSGYRLRSTQELAFPGISGSDAAFVKVEMEGSHHTPLTNDRQSILSLAFRSGCLWSGRHVSLSDRFQLGGPQSVRGIMYNGLGPRDGKDSLGGTAYLATGVSLVTPLPKAPAHWPIRAHAFVNTGSLIDLHSKGSGSNMREVLLQPSVTTGLGLMLPLPMGRIELSFTLPLACRSSDRPRKGLQFGLGVEFL